MDKKAVEALAQTMRLQIIGELRKSPTHASDLSRRISGLDRPTICYHLGILEGAGLIRGEYKFIEPPHSPGKAAKVYTVVEEKFQSTWKELQEILSFADPSLVPKIGQKTQ